MCVRARTGGRLGRQRLTFMQTFQVQHSKSRVTSKGGRSSSQDHLNTVPLCGDFCLEVVLTWSGSFFSGSMIVSLALPPCGL